MSAIPPTALPVVELVRREVPRPSARLVRCAFAGELLFEGSGCDPVGLIPRVPYRNPDAARVAEVLRVSLDAARAWCAWWGEQRDPETAIAAIWGPTPRGAL